MRLDLISILFASSFSDKKEAQLFEDPIHKLLF